MSSYVSQAEPVGSPVGRNNRKKVRRTKLTDPFGRFADVLLNLQGAAHNAKKIPRPKGDSGINNACNTLETFLRDITRIEKDSGNVDDVIGLFESWGLRPEKPGTITESAGEYAKYVVKGYLRFSATYVKFLVTAGELPYSRFGNDPAFETCTPSKDYQRTIFVSIAGDVQPIRTKGMPEGMVVGPRCWPVYHIRANGVVEYAKPVKAGETDKTAVN